VPGEPGACEQACTWAEGCAYELCPQIDRANSLRTDCVESCGGAPIEVVVCGAQACADLEPFLPLFSQEYAAQCREAPPPEPGPIPGCDNPDAPMAVRCADLCGWLGECLVDECPEGEPPLVAQCPQYCLEQVPLVQFVCDGGLGVERCADIVPQFEAILGGDICTAQFP
jgi:hypothetical protein